MSVTKSRPKDVGEHLHHFSNCHKHGVKFFERYFSEVDPTGTRYQFSEEATDLFGNQLSDYVSIWIVEPTWVGHLGNYTDLLTVLLKEFKGLNVDFNIPRKPHEGKLLNAFSVKTPGQDDLVVYYAREDHFEFREFAWGRSSVTYPFNLASGYLRIKEAIDKKETELYI